MLTKVIHLTPFKSLLYFKAQYKQITNIIYIVTLNTLYIIMYTLYTL